MRPESVLRQAVLAATAVAVALLLSAGHGVRAQAGARERTLFVSAVDGAGKPVEGLTPADVVVREDGARREVLRVSRAVEPMDIALLVDNSAASGDLLLPLREGLTRFAATIAAAGGGHNIALVGLAARPTILVDFTTSPTQLTTGIGRLFPERSSGMTLLDGLVEISRGLERRDATRAVIIPVVTDGIEFSNRYYRDVLAAMTQAGVGLHAITIGTFPLSDDDAARNRSLVLDEGPRTTGGQRVVLLSTSAVPAALDKLATELLAQYKVVYGRPESLIPPQKTEVTSSRAGTTMRAMPARGQRTGA
jgi:hypothetical protein